MRFAISILLLHLEKEEWLNFFFQELRLRDRENDFFFGGFIFGGFFFLEVNSPSFGRFQEVNIRFNEFVLS